MEDLILLIDFGSTFTKVLAVDLGRALVVGRSQAPTTPQDNMLTGLHNALARLTVHGQRPDMAVLHRTPKLASSSAAGGLAIFAVGLVPDLTLEAARKAALGAGAKVVGAHAFELDEQALEDIERSQCDIVLLVGGIDGGDKKVILHNARMLAASRLDIPFIVAGNRAAGDTATRLLQGGGKTVQRTANVLPELDRLDVEPARACIRDIFITNIIRAKGLEKAQQYIGATLMPTPKATLQATVLLADGHGSDPGFGELMVVEVGGATINVHSVASTKPGTRDTVIKGLTDPREMRTVEGDLGIRYNAQTILDVIGDTRVLASTDANSGVTLNDLAHGVAVRSRDVEFVPHNGLESAIDIGLARSAVEVAVERHAGSVKESWGVDGMVKIQRGKDLSDLQTVIGTGGIFSHNPDAVRVLEAARASARAPFSLKPKDPHFYVDQDYVLYAVGLLSTNHPDVALQLARRYLLPVNTHCI